MTSNIRKLLFLLLATLCLAGCGGSAGDDLGEELNPVGPPANAVAHQSWGSYRLYRYEAGTWQLLVDRSQPVAAAPVLNERPVLLLHGLGSSITGGALNAMAESARANGATAIFGFEYDTLDPISTNATFLGQALDYLTVNEPARTWRIMGHSMGALVARSSFESGRTFSMAASGNLVSLVAGPHLGSPIAQQLQQGDPSLVDAALRDLILNSELQFRNVDGTPVDVSGDEPSFGQLVPNSTFLNTINFEAANRHPQFAYRTLAGTVRGDELEAFNRALGVFADDGIVNVESANAQVIGPLASETTPQDHLQLLVHPDARLLILRQLGF